MAELDFGISVHSIRRTTTKLRKEGVVAPATTGATTFNKITLDKYSHIPTTAGVYMVCWSNETDWIKIGKAKDIRDRLKGDTTYSAEPLLT